MKTPSASDRPPRFRVDDGRGRKQRRKRVQRTGGEGWPCKEVVSSSESEDSGRALMNCSIVRK
jgi:hypothetical protein